MLARKNLNWMSLRGILLITIVGVPSSSSFCPGGFRPPSPYHPRRPPLGHLPRSSLKLLAVGDYDGYHDEYDEEEDAEDRGDDGSTSGSGSLDGMLRGVGSTKDGNLDFNFNSGGSSGRDSGGFNPLSYAKSGAGQRHGKGLSYDTQTSLRRAKMLELTGELLRAVDGAPEGKERDEMAREVLDRYQALLLQPLEDSEAVLVSVRAFKRSRV
jgi:hypothetical protein